ncbi:MAG: hypothetical protein ABFD13_05005 [Candidatus Cryosericum sp.]|nr:hypothetical protein [bacterium]
MRALVFSTNNYRSFPSRKQRFAHHLMKRGYDVLYVEAPVTLLAAAHPGMWRKLNAWRSGIHRQDDGMSTASPTPWLPYFKRHEAIADHDALTYYKWLQHLPGDWTRDIDLVLTYLPFIPRTLELIGGPVIYDCVDDHSAYPGLIDKSTVDRLERRSAKLASAIIATNETIAAKFAADVDKLSLIQNGVDHDVFAAPALAWLATLDVLPQQHKLLYVGAMREWFDVQTMLSIATAFPEYEIDCFGEAIPSVRTELSTHRNIILKGTWPQSSIAQVAPQYDLALIPFRESPLTSGVDPLKFYEYVSAGLPVVSSKINALGEFDETMVRVAASGDEFLTAIQETIATDSLRLRHHRIQVSQRFDWAFRISEFDHVLDALTHVYS